MQEWNKMFWHVHVCVRVYRTDIYCYRNAFAHTHAHRLYIHLLASCTWNKQNQMKWIEMKQERHFTAGGGLLEIHVSVSIARMYYVSDRASQRVCVFVRCTKPFTLHSVMLRIEIIEVIRFQWVNHVSMRFVQFQLPLNVIMNASIHRYRFDGPSSSLPVPCHPLPLHACAYIFLWGLANICGSINTNKCKYIYLCSWPLQKLDARGSSQSFSIIMTNTFPSMYTLASSVALQPISNSLNDYCFSIMLDYDKSHLSPFQKSKIMLFLLLLPLCIILLYSSTHTQN